MFQCFADQNMYVSLSTSNSKHSSFLYKKNNENTYPKGRALVQMYRVVQQTKRGNCMCNENES